MLSIWVRLYPLPNDKFLDLSKSEAFADNEKFDLDRLENIAVKGENAGYKHFLLFPQCFQKASFFHGC